MMIALTETNRPLQINYAEILTLGGKMLFEIPLREVDSERKMYLADPFLPPDEFFYISVSHNFHKGMILPTKNHSYLRIASLWWSNFSINPKICLWFAEIDGN